MDCTTRGYVPHCRIPGGCDCRTDTGWLDRKHSRTIHRLSVLRGTFPGIYARNVPCQTSLRVGASRGIYPSCQPNREPPVPWITGSRFLHDHRDQCATATYLPLSPERSSYFDPTNRNNGNDWKHWHSHHYVLPWESTRIHGDADWAATSRGLCSFDVARPKRDRLFRGILFHWWVPTVSFNGTRFFAVVGQSRRYRIGIWPR